MIIVTIIIIIRLCEPVTGMSLKLVYRPVAGTFYVGPVAILSGPVTFPITNFNTIYGILKPNVGFGSCRVGRQKS